MEIIKGVQMYSLAKEIQREGLDEVLKAIKRSGFTYLEFAGYYGLSPKELKAKLDENGLKAYSLHAGLGTAEEHIPYAEELCMGMAYVSYISPETLWGAGYGAAIEQINEMKRIFGAAGVELGYHNHAQEFLHGDRVADIIAATGISSELDIYWAVAAGKNPLYLIKEYGSSLSALHVKDMDKRVTGSPTEYPNAIIGEGKCNAEAAVKAALGQGVNAFILEAEYLPCGADEYLKKCYENLSAFLA